MSFRHFCSLCCLLVLVLPGKATAAVEYGHLLGLSDVPQTISLNSTFIDPVIVAGPASFDDPDPGVVVVDNVTPTSFDIRFREWNYLDQSHGSESVTYFVVERGVTNLASGAVIQAGSTWLGGNWGRLLFAQKFSRKPRLFTTISSSLYPGTVAPRIKRLRKTGFDSRYWQEEQASTEHGEETLNWIAISQTGGQTDAAVDGFAWELFELRVDERFTTASFSNNFESSCVLADVTSATANPYTVRYENLTNAGIDLVVQEEQSKDNETRLSRERLSVLVLDCSPPPEPDTEPPSWSDTAIITSNLSHSGVELSWSPGATDDGGTVSYEVLLDRVVIASSAAQELLVTDLQPNTEYSFIVKAIDAAGNSAELNASIVTLPTPPQTNPAVIELGFVEALTGEFLTVEFEKPFLDPVVVAGPASSNFNDAGVVVIDNVTTTSFDIRFREWNYLNGEHGLEAVSYLVLERGETILPSGTRVQAGTTVMGAAWSPVSYQAPFDNAPVVLTTVGSAFGDSTVAPRLRFLDGGGFQTRFWLEEANAASHGSEDLNWIAFEKGLHDGSDGEHAWETLTILTDEKFKAGSFVNTYKNVCVVGDINSLTPNSSTLRYRALTQGDIEVHLQEEQSLDVELLLGVETASFLVAECTNVDKEPPTWLEPRLSVLSSDPFSVELSFGAAVDNEGLAFYRILVNGQEVAQTNNTSYLVNNLVPNTDYIFSVEAVDHNDNISETVLSVPHTTDVAPLAEVAGYIWQDRNFNGIQEETEPGIFAGEVLLFKDSGNEIGVLDSEDSLEASTSSLPDGSYRFAYLEQGAYIVTPGSVIGYSLFNSPSAIPLALTLDEAVSNISFGFKSDSVSADSIGDGYDWSSLSSARRAPDTGVTWVVYDEDSQDALALANRHALDVFGVGTTSYTSPRFAVFVEMEWRVANPEEAVYDWAAVDSIVNDVLENAAPGVGYFIWPKIYGEYIPQWVNTKHDASFDTKPRQIFTKKDEAGDYLFNQELEVFLVELANRYALDPRLVYIDMRTAFDTTSGEWNVKGDEGADDSNDEVDVKAWTSAYHQLWYDIFKADTLNADVGKLVSVIAWPHLGGSELLGEVFASGMGQRDGQPSRWQIWKEAYASSVNDENYLVTDETNLAVTGDAIRYSEATEFSFKNDNFGPRDTTIQRLRAALLWSLHSRRNWMAVPQQLLWASDSSRLGSLSESLKRDFDEGQQLVQWLQLQLGHNATTANDAWSWTRETLYSRYDNNKYDDDTSTTLVKNLERWLYQRDIPNGGMTQAAKQTARNSLFAATRSGIVCDETYCEHYRARQTNSAVGQPYMYFNVDRAFMGASPSDVELKVTYHDIAGGEWALEYHDGVSVRSTPVVPSSSSNELKTVTLELFGFSANDYFEEFMDFRIVSVGDGDAVIEFTRLIDLDGQD